MLLGSSCFPTSIHKISAKKYFQRDRLIYVIKVGFYSSAIISVDQTKECTFSIPVGSADVLLYQV